MSLRKEIIKKLGEDKAVKDIVEELKEQYQGDIKKLRRYVYIVRCSINKTKKAIATPAETSTDVVPPTTPTEHSAGEESKPAE